MKPYLSIVIPYFNAPEKLARLLASLGKSKRPPTYEIIVVDDGSKTEPSPVSGRSSEGGKNRFRPGMTKIIRLKHNKGPAIARNRGVDAARGKFIVFMDADVEAFPDTLREIAKIYDHDPDVVALTGVWVRAQRSRDFFPNFKAIRDWSYWIHERDQSGYYFLFSTRIASIKKSVFLRLGGFNESYPAPLVEDIELTYRIARRYAIIFAAHVRVRHEFEGFWPIAKKYFWRTYYWTKLYETRKKFDPVATTVWETATAVTGVGAVGVIGIGLVAFFFAPMPWIRTYCLTGGSLLLVLHVFFLRKFLWFSYREKGFVFALKSLGIGLVLYLFIVAGALYYKIRKTA